MSKIILTGDRPTGRLHIGHYVGSLRRRVELQNSGEFDEIYIMIADAQALTDNVDNPEKIRTNIIEVALDYLSAGLDPAKSNILIQSQIPELTELTFYYMNLVTVARLQRNPHCEDRDPDAQVREQHPGGLFHLPDQPGGRYHRVPGYDRTRRRGSGADDRADQGDRAEIQCDLRRDAGGALHPASRE